MECLAYTYTLRCFCTEIDVTAFRQLFRSETLVTMRYKIILLVACALWIFLGLNFNYHIKSLRIPKFGSRIALSVRRSIHQMWERKYEWWVFIIELWISQICVMVEHSYLSIDLHKSMLCTVHSRISIWRWYWDIWINVFWRWDHKLNDRGLKSV